MCRDFFVVLVLSASSAPANEFFPATVSAAVGDIIRFTLANGMHNVTSTSVPGGALAMSSGTLSTVGQQYNYTVTVAGTYLYGCTFHAGMSGSVNVAASGIATATVDLLTTAYPNHF